MRSSRPSTTTSTSVPAFNPAASAAALGTRTPRLLPHLASLTFISFRSRSDIHCISERLTCLATSFLVSFLGPRVSRPLFLCFQDKKKKERAGGTPALLTSPPAPARWRRCRCATPRRDRAAASG